MGIDGLREVACIGLGYINNVCRLLRLERPLWRDVNEPCDHGQQGRLLGEHFHVGKRRYAARAGDIPYSNVTTLPTRRAVVQAYSSSLRRRLPIRVKLGSAIPCYYHVPRWAKRVTVALDNAYVDFRCSFIRDDPELWRVWIVKWVLDSEGHLPDSSEKP